MKQVILFLAIFTVFINPAITQDFDDETENIISNVIAPPNRVLALKNGRSTSTVNIWWEVIEAADHYILRIYRASDNSTYDTIMFSDDVTPPILIENLESGTKYFITISAVFNNSNGRNIETEESIPVEFKTERKCYGGQHYSECNAHCISTCGDPDPVCSRICQPGCACPLDLPIWHEETCIPRILCPILTGEPIRPSNVHLVFIYEGRNAMIGWDPVNNTSEYTIQVRAADFAAEKPRSFKSESTNFNVTDLTPGENYEFLVTANLPDENEIMTDIPPPSNISTINVTSTGFRVQWTAQPDAVRHIFQLYDESRTSLLYTNTKIAASAIDIEGLVPGTTYYYAVASARTEEIPGTFSPLQQVQTLNGTSGIRDFQPSLIVGIPATITASTATATRPNTLDVEVLDFQAVNVQTTSLTLQWRIIGNANIDFFVITIESDSEEIARRTVDGNSNSLLLNGLQPGVSYYFQIYAVDENGLSGSATSFEITTSLLNKPSNARVIETTETSVRISWDYDASVPYYVVQLELSEPGQVVQTFADVTTNEITIENLNNSLQYVAYIIAISSRVNLTELEEEFAIYRSPATRVEFQLQCELSPLDLLYVVDTSSSIGSRSNLTNIREMFRDITSAVPAININSGTRIATVSFFNRVFVRNNFNVFKHTRTFASLLSRIITYKGEGSSNITKALNYVKERFFSSDTLKNYRTRLNALSVVIVFSAGPLGDLERAVAAANSLKSVTNVISIGVQGISNDEVLSIVSSRPDLKIVVPNFNDLENIGGEIVQKLCTLL